MNGFAEDERVEAHDLETGDSFVSSIDNVAVETGFYDLEADGQTLSLESWLSNIEDRAAPIVRRLVSKPASLYELAEDEMDAVARLVCAQLHRNSAMVSMATSIRSQMVDRAKTVTKRMLEKRMGDELAERAWDTLFEDEPDHYWLGEDRERMPSEALAYILSETQGFVNALRAMPWRLAEPSGGFRFYTSDNGVSEWPYPSAVWPVFFEWLYCTPLATNCVLLIGPGLVETGPARSVAPLSPWGTVQINHLTSICAARFLYGPGPFLSRPGQPQH